MKKTAEIVEALKRMGYNPEIDEDGDVYLVYEMKAILFLMDDDGESYCSVRLLKVYEMDEEDALKVLAACNKLNRERRVVKTYIEEDFKSISAAYEFYYDDNSSLDNNIEKALALLGIIRTLFRRTLVELSE